MLLAQAVAVVAIAAAVVAVAATAAVVVAKGAPMTEGATAAAAAAIAATDATKVHSFAGEHAHKKLVYKVGCGSLSSHPGLVNRLFS